MSPGQTRAFRELQRLHAADPDGFEIIATELTEKSRSLYVTLSLRLGPMENREGGLSLREREEFTLLVSPDFPFEYPSLYVTHDRFAGFPHVIWSTWLCLYQSKVEWNPADGLYGFFDRLKLWLGRAALNDMDPVEGPLEPPHHVTDFSQVPFLIRCNAPVTAGESWFGLAELEKHGNRTELVGWNDLTKAWPENRNLALAVILPKRLPMEFPQKGKEFLAELIKQGFDKHRIIKYLALAASLSPANEPIHLVLGIPMRRAADGGARLHVAVWTTAAAFREKLMNVLPKGTDTQEILSLRTEIAEAVCGILECSEISWCRVMEDREEIVVRRDAGTPAAGFKGKRVLILGCGALGSWIGELVLRARPAMLHLLDNSIVKPGLLARQNYLPKDIGENKARALAAKLREISPDCAIEPFTGEAHGFLFEKPDRVRAYDLILDCTASSTFQMKLERDWSRFDGLTPPVISVIIDAKARQGLAIVLGQNSLGGIWDAFVRLKHKLCLDGTKAEIISSFYSPQASEGLFQPEPGCSDPTFSGSATDVINLASTALNFGVPHVGAGGDTAGLVISHKRAVDVLMLKKPAEVNLGEYKVRIQKNVYREAKAWARQNSRVRSAQHETGGLLWGMWDDAVGVIWVFDASGPPPDSLHDPGHFVCGVKGTAEEHRARHQRSNGTSGFIGFWHTHPDMPSFQSGTDIAGMAGLVSGIGGNQKRAIMLIFGRTDETPTAGIYIYESSSRIDTAELISVGEAQIRLEAAIV